MTQPAARAPRPGAARRARRGAPGHAPPSRGTRSSPPRCRTRIIIALIAVLKRSASMSSVTFWMVLWHEAPGRLVVRRRVARERRRGDVPDALEEAPHPFDPARLPGLHLLERAHEHLVDAQRVGAVVAHDVVGVDDVAARLAHLLVVLAEDHPLVNELQERLGVLHHARGRRAPCARSARRAGARRRARRRRRRGRPASSRRRPRGSTPRASSCGSRKRR